MRIDKQDVERALGRTVSSYDVAPIDPHLRIHSVTGGVYRVRAGGDTCIVKVVLRSSESTPDGLWGGDVDVDGRNYWKREWLAFASGLLDRLPGRLRAPRTLLAEERGDDECWIWMADVSGRHNTSLTLDDYATIAHAAGTTQGAFASGAAALPDDAWLSRNWLRGWVGACAGFVDESDDPRVHALWAAREELLALVDAAPRTVVHCDFWPANLYVTGDGGVVAIDWSQVGIGALAQDLDQITLDTVWMQARPDESLDALEERIVPAYVSGLHEAGCDVSEHELRRWYAAATALHYAWMGGAQTRRARDQEAVAAAEARFGRPYADLTADRMRVVRRAVELGERALDSRE